MRGTRSPPKVVSMGERLVGGGEPALVVAEVGLNHDGDLKTALALVDAAASAGAEAVKLQTFVPAALVVAGAPLAGYQRDRVSGVADQREMLERLCLPVEDLQAVAERSQRNGLIFLSSPFDIGSASVLERLGAPAFKVGSGELTNLPFLGELAGRGRPLIVSTGMGTLAEVHEAVHVVQAAGAPLILLHC